MSAITVWIDESEVVHNGKSYWIIGQLITNSDGEELEFLRKLRVAHKDARTWDTLHACEFKKSHDKKWALLLSWINIFLEDDRVFFHSFVFEKSAEWEPRFPTPHDYFAHQILFGLANKMKPRGSEIQTLFHDVDAITAIMDRRSANSGFILKQENLPSISIGRINELETIYEERMLSTLRGISKRLVNLRFSFANSRCFDGLQLCDCLTYLVRQRLMSEMGIEANAGKRGEFVNLFGEHFANGDMQTLKDFSYCRKFQLLSWQLEGSVAKGHVVALRLKSPETSRANAKDRPAAVVPVCFVFRFGSASRCRIYGKPPVSGADGSAERKLLLARPAPFFPGKSFFRFVWRELRSVGSLRRRSRPRPAPRLIPSSPPCDPPPGPSAARPSPALDGAPGRARPGDSSPL